MIFWYPGEAGSTKEAEPVLSDLFLYLNQRISPHRISGKYFNTLKDGKDFVTKTKPTLGILSHAAWLANKKNLPQALEWLATNPLPHGQPFERYSIVGLKPIDPNPLAIFTSEPFDQSYLKVLFSNLPSDVKVEYTTQMFQQLREIGQLKLTTYALLNPAEAYTLNQLSLGWAKSLKVVAVSKAVPSARIILFRPWNEADKLKKILVDMKNNNEGRALLNSLRLYGFSEIYQQSSPP